MVHYPAGSTALLSVTNMAHKCGKKKQKNKTGGGHKDFHGTVYMYIYIIKPRIISFFKMTFLATSLSVTGNMSIKAEILFEIHLLNTLRLMVSLLCEVASAGS